MNDEYAKHSEARKAYTDAAITSEAHKKLIIAGPGTGKSFLFQEICKRNLKKGATNNLALSFINELVDDLSRDLHQLAEVKTLHSFALSQIPKKKKIFLNLGSIIACDYATVFDTKTDYKSIFRNLIDSKEALDFYSKRRQYYDFFSPDCSIYTLIKIFEGNNAKIPKYSQILIDEFQDFNKLESHLLSFLAKKSPVLIVGDDDQSLYGFKHAAPEDIQSKHSSGEFETFELPYCSRCTEVIIDAYSKIIEEAKKNGYLESRVPKKYMYFPSKEKDSDSNEYPKIALKRGIYQKTVAYNIDKEIQTLFDPRASHFPTVLIICPLPQQIGPIEKMLRTKGFKNIDANQKYTSDLVLEGFNLLLENSSCNLAWRILFEAECEKNDKLGRFKEVVKKSFESNTPFKDLLTVDERRPIKRARSAMKKILKGNDVEDAVLEEVFTLLGYNPTEIAQDKVRNKLALKSVQKNIYKNTPIKIVTMLKSKGLTQDYTFLVNFDDRFLLDKGAVTDDSICKFLVALTRARKRVSIYTNKNEPPTFVQWIPEYLIDDCT